LLSSLSSSEPSWLWPWLIGGMRSTAAIAALAYSTLMIVDPGVVRRSIGTCLPVPSAVAERLRAGDALEGLSNIEDGTSSSYCVRCCVWRRPARTPSPGVFVCASPDLRSACATDVYKRCRMCNHIPHHCSLCQRCVLAFDHHCGVLGICVTAANYAYFCTLIAAAQFSAFLGGCALLAAIAHHAEKWPWLVGGACVLGVALPCMGLAGCALIARFRHSFQGQWRRPLCQFGMGWPSAAGGHEVLSALSDHAIAPRMMTGANASEHTVTIFES